MFAAMLGAISATDSPTADQTDSERLSPGPPDGFASIYASLLDFVPIVSLHPTRYGRGKKYESTIQPAPFPCPRAFSAPFPARRAPRPSAHGVGMAPGTTPYVRRVPSTARRRRRECGRSAVGSVLACPK